MLTDIARRNSTFAQQLQMLAQQANIEPGSVQGTVTVTGEGKVYGQIAGTNTGMMNATYTFGSHDDDK